MTRLLFETSQEEPEKKPRRGTQRPAQPAQAASPSQPAGGPRLLEAVGFLGKCDGEHECVDEACRFGAHDVVGGSPGRWRLQCAECGTIQTVTAVSEMEAVVTEQSRATPAAGGFVFNGGLFDGLTIDEASMSPRGMDYISWAAKEHPRQAVKNACEIWLARSPESR